MAGFQCPFCGQIMSVNSSTLTTHRINFGINEVSPLDATNTRHLRINVYKCPNSSCGQESIYASGIKGYIDDSFVPIFPQTVCIHFPDYVPAPIREDYEEACSIVNQSPKAAATLARRCLQGMIRDFWGIHGKNLNAEITQLKDHVSPSQWKAIDAIRSVGNIGAHMEHDVNLIVEVDASEAQKLLKLIEHLIDKWYIDRHDSEELYMEVTSIGDEKSKARGK